MAKVLVTGGTGYIGSHTVVELQKEGFEVIIVDNLSNSNIDVLNGIEKITGSRPAFENIDCVDYVSMDRMFEKYNNVEAIIHFAASKAVGESVEKQQSSGRVGRKTVDVLPQQSGFVDQSAAIDAYTQG